MPAGIGVTKLMDWTVLELGKFGIPRILAMGTEGVNNISNMPERQRRHSPNCVKKLGSTEGVEDVDEMV